MLRWRDICRFYPFRHHLETGEVLRQSLEFITVPAEDDGSSGDDRSPSDEGERAMDCLAFAFPCRGVALREDRFIYHHDDATACQGVALCGD